MGHHAHGSGVRGAAGVLEISSNGLVVYLCSGRLFEIWSHLGSLFLGQTAHMEIQIALDPWITGVYYAAHRDRIDKVQAGKRVILALEMQIAHITICCYN